MHPSWGSVIDFLGKKTHDSARTTMKHRYWRELKKERERDRESREREWTKDEGINRRRIKGAASICHSADGMSEENRKIGPSRSCSNSPRNPRRKAQHFQIPPLYLYLSSPLRKFACLEIFFSTPLMRSPLETIRLDGLNGTSFHFLPFLLLCLPLVTFARWRASSDLHLLGD